MATASNEVPITIKIDRKELDKALDDAYSLRDQLHRATLDAVALNEAVHKIHAEFPIRTVEQVGMSPSNVNFAGPPHPEPTYAELKETNSDLTKRVHEVNNARHRQMLTIASLEQRIVAQATTIGQYQKLWEDAKAISEQGSANG